MAWDGKEKRLFSRADFACKIIVTAPPLTLISRTENISKGGMRVILAKRLEVLDMVDLELSLKRDKIIRCKGKVIWVKEKAPSAEAQSVMFDTGIQFIGISHSDRDYIGEVVEAVLTGK